MHFQEVFSAIFLKNRKLKSSRFPPKSEKVWAENLQICYKTGFWRWCDEIGNFSEKWGRMRCKVTDGGGSAGTFVNNELSIS